MLERMKEIWLDAKQMRDERGLTLIELLVVVVILGIIAAIAVVAIGGLIENSRKDAVVSDAKQLVSAAKLYASSNPIQAGESIILGINEDGDPITSTPVGDDVPVRKESLSKYIDTMKDSLNSDADYKDSFVLVKEVKGKYTYTVTLNSKKTTNKYFDGISSDALKRSTIEVN